MNTNNKGTMYLFLQFLCAHSHFLNALDNLSKGKSVQLSSVTVVFSDDPDVVIYHDYPELENHNGVGFFSDYEPTVLVSYQEFYDSLQKTVEDFTNTNSDYKIDAQKYLSTIKKRYNIK